jgi:MarR family transcriptional regulator, lower aerobic nicotinate degradation pathway regulator
MNVVDPDSVSTARLAGPPKELLASMTFLLKRLGHAAKERTFQAFEGTGLNAFHYAVLALLDEDPRDAQAVIADALGYDRSHLVRLLDELEEAELVIRRRDPEDRRRHVVKMTPAGAQALARMREVVRRVEEDFLAPLDAEQRRELHDLLLRLMAHHDPRCSVFGPLRNS